MSNIIDFLERESLLGVTIAVSLYLQEVRDIILVFIVIIFILSVSVQRLLDVQWENTDVIL